MNASAMLLASLVTSLADISARLIAGAIDDARATEEVRAAVAEWQQAVAEVGEQIAAGRRIIDAALAKLPRRAPVLPLAPPAVVPA